MGIFSFASMASRCAQITGISGQLWVGWPCCSQMTQGGTCCGSVVALVFLPLVLSGWGGAGVGALVGLCGLGGG